MENIRCCVGIMVLLFFINFFRVSAMETGFATEALPEEKVETFLENIKLTRLTSEPNQTTIECFDVNDEGEYALGHANSDKKTISLYKSEGAFECCYTFNCSGSFGIELFKEGLKIYFVRSDNVVEINLLGEVISVKEIQNTTENNSYWNHFVFADERMVGDKKYILQNDAGVLNIFASSYSQLVIKEADGTETIIYDVSDMSNLRLLLGTFGVLIFAGIVIIVLIRQILKSKREYYKKMEASNN